MIVGRIKRGADSQLQIGGNGLHFSAPDSALVGFAGGRSPICLARMFRHLISTGRSHKKAQRQGLNVRDANQNRTGKIARGDSGLQICLSTFRLFGWGVGGQCSGLKPDCKLTNKRKTQTENINTKRRTTMKYQLGFLDWECVNKQLNFAPWKTFVGIGGEIAFMGIMQDNQIPVDVPYLHPRVPHPCDALLVCRTREIIGIDVKSTQFDCVKTNTKLIDCGVVNWTKPSDYICCMKCDNVKNGCFTFTGAIETATLARFRKRVFKKKNAPMFEVPLNAFMSPKQFVSLMRMHDCIDSFREQKAFFVEWEQGSKVGKRL